MVDLEIFGSAIMLSTLDPSQVEMQQYIIAIAIAAIIFIDSA